MTKEEFIKLINTLDFEELKCATISYYKNKPYSHNRDQQLMREIDNLKSIMESKK